MKLGLGVSEIVRLNTAVGHREGNQIALIGDGRVGQHVAVTFPTRRVKPIRRASTRPRVLIGWRADMPHSKRCNLWIAGFRKVFRSERLLHLKHISWESCSVDGAFENKVWPFVAE